MKVRASNRFYCFSPPVMVATFLIEVGLATWVFFRYKKDIVWRLVLATLVLLGIFQLAEYRVCEFEDVFWSRIGFASITLLPVIGYHLIHALRSNGDVLRLRLAYMSSVVLILYFLLHPLAFSSYECTGNYVIFSIGAWQSTAYSIYYFGMMFLIMMTVYRWARKDTNMNRHTRKALLATAYGYATFIIPMAILMLIYPDTSHAIPSVMCGLAVIYALIITFVTLPEHFKSNAD